MLRSARRTLVSIVALLLGSGLGVAACLDTDPQETPQDAGGDVPFIDARPRDPIPPADADTDTVQSDDASVDAAVDAPVVVIDTSPPERVADLAATPSTHAVVVLSWTAPADLPGGPVSAYELRFSQAPITTLEDFLAATPITSPAPLDPGSAQTFTVASLSPATEYHFAIRARDAAGNVGVVSNDATVSTKPRATFLVSEIAPANTAAEGGDFVELVAVSAGSAAGLEVRYASATSSSALLYTFAATDVAAGDRVVVRPATNNVLASSSVISVVDGAAYQDAVAYSDRGVNASATIMSAFAALHAAGAWAFSAEPVDSADDCAVLREVVNADASSSSPACGGYPGFLAPGFSLQRSGVSDTNTRQDFSVAAQTPDAANAPYCAPEGAALALTEVNPSADLLELTVTQGGSLRGFTIRRDPRASSPFGTLLGNMPALCVTAGDVIVLHVNAPDGSVSEVTAKDELDAANHPGTFDTAWDVFHTTSASALPYATSLVIAVRAPTGDYVEGAAFSSRTVIPSDGGTYHQALAYLQSVGLWSPADCGGVPCTNASSPTARDVAASWNGVGSVATDASCARSSPTSTREAASWTVGASSFGQ